MKNFYIYNPEAVREAYARSKKVLIVADYRGVNYEDDNNTEIAKLADEIDIEYYPVLVSFSKSVQRVINSFYRDHIVFVENSLLTS